MAQELILKVESKVIDANTAKWQAEQREFLSSLTKKFETDDDFARAETEVKEVEAREKAAKQALQKVLNGSKDVADLVSSVEAVIEDLRQARLNHTKAIKTEKDNRKNAVIQCVIDELSPIYSIVSKEANALKLMLPQAEMQDRLRNSAKGKKTISGLEKGLNAELTTIKSEILTTQQEINARFGLIPKKYEHLFVDGYSIVAFNGYDAIKVIVDERIKQDIERKEKERLDVENKTNANANETQRVDTNHIHPENEKYEPKHTFSIVVEINTTLTHAQEVAKSLKDQYGSVRLIKSKS